MTSYLDLPGPKEVTKQELQPILDGKITASEPLVLRGLVSDWPIVDAGTRGFTVFQNYLSSIADSAPKAPVFAAPAHTKGRFGYGKTLRDYNFTVHAQGVFELLNSIEKTVAGTSDFFVYGGSMLARKYFPGFDAENLLPLTLPVSEAKLWLGTKSRISAHFDASHNVACVVAGKRRFTLFPPSEVFNLYPGPFDFTPAGQVISLVDFHNPDPSSFPGFEKALQNGVTVSLHPGDAIFIPSMWWHHVECDDIFGGLVNYWWDVPGTFDFSASDALIASFIAIGRLPESERQAWRNVFDVLVFGQEEQRQAHLTSKERGAFTLDRSEDNQGLWAYLRKRITEL